MYRYSTSNLWVNLLFFPLHQDEVLFDSWDAIFNEGRLKDGVPVYSFDGRDVLSDAAWWFRPETKQWTPEVSRKLERWKLFCPSLCSGRRRCCGTALPVAGSGTPRAFARPGVRASTRRTAWRRLFTAAAASSSSALAAAPAPTPFCASRTATSATPGDRPSQGQAGCRRQPCLRLCK